MENQRNSAPILLILSLIGTTLVTCYPNPRPSSDGSKCPNTSCSPPISGAQCTPKYERDDGCCPVWYCNSNGAISQIYGKSIGSSSSSSSSWSSSSSSGSGSGGGGMPNFPSFGGLNIQLPNFGNLFGRR